MTIVRARMFGFHIKINYSGWKFCMGKSDGESRKQWNHCPRHRTVFICPHICCCFCLILCWPVQGAWRLSPDQIINDWFQNYREAGLLGRKRAAHLRIFTRLRGLKVSITIVDRTGNLMQGKLRKICTIITNGKCGQAERTNTFDRRTFWQTQLFGT